MTEISDAERRDVERRLREWAWKSAPPECLLNQLAFGDDCPGMDDDQDSISCDECEVMAAHRLADLIDPDCGTQETASSRVPESDRDALLALAEDVAESAAMATVMDASEGAKMLAEMLLDIARRIREACGEVGE